MYMPPHFVETDAAEVRSVIADHPLAALVAATADGLVANHIPLLAEEDGALIGHVALANDLHRTVPDGSQVLAIFRSEAAYVSPNWYPTKAETHRSVPTWNYQVVHVTGRIAFSHDEKVKRAAVGRLTKAMEGRLNGAEGWRMSDAPRDYMDMMIGNIVAFRIDPTRILAKSKLSQNRERADFEAVVQRFEATGVGRLAGRMRRYHEARED